MMDFISSIDLGAISVCAALLAIISLADSGDAPDVQPVLVAKNPDRKPLPRTGLIYHSDCLLHDPGRGHPEQPARLTAIMRGLDETGMLPRLALLPAGAAPIEWLTAVHDPEYVAEVEAAVRSNTAYLHAPDTPISPGSWAAALMAAGGAPAAVDAIMEDKVVNAFCATRPPGHHALRNRAMGFCLFNNAAIGVRYAQSRHGLRRVLIVDWDVHHGNGTQLIFRGDPDIMFFSVHQFPFYPGTGGPDSGVESAAGCGGAVNVPLPAGSGDAEYIRAFEEILRPRAAAFRPDLVLISAGFDAHERDPLGGMRVTTAGFARLTMIVRQIAAQSCQNRLVSVLEGGYNLESLPEAVCAHLGELMPV